MVEINRQINIGAVSTTTVEYIVNPTEIKELIKVIEKIFDVEDIISFRATVEEIKNGIFVEVKTRGV